MKISKNNVTLIGNIGSAARMVNLENGSKIARFSLALDKSVRVDNGKIKRQTEWHTVYAWGNLARFIEDFAEKGKKVAVHGRMVSRTFYNPNGVAKTVEEIELQHIIGLS